MVEKNSKWYRQPWVIYIIITSVIGLATFFIGHYTQPLAFKIETNIKQIEEIKKCLDERPTNKELAPVLENIKEDIRELKETIDKIYDYVVKEKAN